VCVGAGSAHANDLEFRILAGKWTCPICDSKHMQENQTTCEDQGHAHALKLNNGTMITFVPSNRSTALIHGGGRHSFPIKVAGFYDQKHQTLDVECYEIEGMWTTWCEQEQRMDLCRAGGRETAEEKQTSAK
jgi:hypothetical protein